MFFFFFCFFFFFVFFVFVVVVVEMTRPQYTIHVIKFRMRVVIFSGMHRNVNTVIIQRYSTTCLVNEPPNAYSIGVGV